MGLFDLFGGGKKKAAEEEAAAEQLKERDRESRIEAAKKAHEGMPWPTVQPLNLLRLKEGEGTMKAEDPISPERKDELGEMIYDPDLTADAVTGLTLQELLFLLDTHLIFNRKAALENYEKVHRVFYNELLSRINQSKELYILYNAVTGYPLIDSGFGLVYLEEEHAKTAAQLYGKQFHKVAVAKRPGENADPGENGKRPMSLFDFLYYLGIENVLIDNGWYKAAVKRSEISADPTSYITDPSKIPPAAPQLAFALIDYEGEAKWPVKYDKRNENLQRKMARINALIPKSKFVIPAQVIKREDVPEGTDPAKAQEVRYPLIGLKGKKKDGTEVEQKFLPIFTDLLEYSRNFASGDFRPIYLEFPKMAGLLRSCEGFIINPKGENFIIPKVSALVMMGVLKPVPEGGAQQPKKDDKVIQFPGNTKAPGTEPADPDKQ